MLRTFIAIPVPDDAKKKLFEIRDSVQLKNKYRWEPDDKIHITLNFIGETQTESIHAIKSILEELTTFKSFPCEFVGFKFFIKRGEPKILFADLHVDNIIFTLEKKISERLKNFNILADTKPYHPHLTLLRIKNDVEEGFIESFTSVQFPKISFKADEIVFYESILLQTGSVYKRLKSIYLSK